MPNVPIPSPYGYMAQLGIIQDALSSASITTDAQYVSPRLSRRGELMSKVVYQTLHTLSNEGSLYVAQTATPAVGITGWITMVTFLDTVAIFGFNNLDPVKTVIPLSLQVVFNTAGAGSTSANISGRLDLGAGISGANTVNVSYQQLTGKACNPINANDGAAQIYFGQVACATATGNVRRMGRAETRSQIYVAGDTVTVLWGAVEEVQALPISGTGASNIVVHMPATECPPGWCYALNEWSTARSTGQIMEAVFQYVVR